MRSNDHHLVSGSGDADIQQSPRCGTLRLGVLIAQEIALVLLPLDEQDAVELFALGFVDGHEHAAARVALVGLKFDYVKHAAYQVGGATVGAAKIPSRDKQVSDLISRSEEPNKLGVRQQIRQVFPDTEQITRVYPVLCWIAL